MTLGYTNASAHVFHLIAGAVTALSVVWYLVNPLDNWLAWIAAAYVVTVISNAGGFSVGFHRYFTHNAFKTNKFGEYVFCYLISAFQFISPTHNGPKHVIHHDHSDVVGKDPDLPESNWLDEKKNILTLARHHLRMERKNPLLKQLNDYFYLGVIVHLLVVCFLFGLEGLVFLWAIPAALATGGLTREVPLNHFKNENNPLIYKTYEMFDSAYNTLVFAFISGGESFHNNHHHDIENPKFSTRWFEFDIGYLFVWAMRTDR